MDKKFWLKLDKNKIILQLRDLGKRFSLRRGSSRRSFLIIFIFFVLVGAGAAIYRYNYAGEREENSGISIELNEVIDSSSGIPDGDGEGEASRNDAGDGEQTALNKEGSAPGETGGAQTTSVNPAIEREYPADKESRGDGQTERTEENARVNETTVENARVNETTVENARVNETAVENARVNETVEEDEPVRESEETITGVVTEPLRPVMQEEERSFTLLKPVTGDLLREPGWYYHPVLEDWRYNHGIEFSGNNGDIVMAAAAGRIVSVEEDAYRGILVLVDHDNGWLTEYGHLQKTVVSRGEVVARGQEIGRLGETGISAEPALYFALRNTESMIDPLEYFE